MENREQLVKIMMEHHKENEYARMSERINYLSAVTKGQLDADTMKGIVTDAIVKCRRNQEKEHDARAKKELEKMAKKNKKPKKKLILASTFAQIRGKLFTAKTKQKVRNTEKGKMKSFLQRKFLPKRKQKVPVEKI